MRFDGEDGMAAGDSFLQNNGRTGDIIKDATVYAAANPGEEEPKTTMPKKIDLNWRWSEGLKPSGRPILEVLADARKEFLEKEGRLYTMEEAAQLVDDIRKELRQKEDATGKTESGAPMWLHCQGNGKSYISRSSFRQCR